MSSIPVSVSKKTVISIDIGSTYSGVSVFPITSSSPETIRHKNEKGENVLKNKTCVLYNSSFKLDSIGFEASKKYNDMTDDEKNNYYFLSNLKQKLFTDPSEEVSITENGKEFHVVGVIADYLASLASLALGMYKLSKSDVQWVATIPANWDREHIDVVKKIFYKAGLVELEDPGEEDLMILLEPEAAAVFILEECKSQIQMKEGDRYLVIDAGGGTVDCTAVVVKHGKLKSSRYSDAINQGSTKLDLNLFKYLEKELTSQIFSQLSSIHLYDIAKEWENQKLNISDFPANDICGLRLDQKLPACLNGHKMVKARAILIRKPVLEQEVYDPVISQIESFLEKILDKEVFNYLVFVGGFSQCTPLMNRMNIFQSSGKIVVAQNGSESVVKGAAYLGRNPEIIAVRCSKFAYGIETEREFRQGRDPQKRLKVYKYDAVIPMACTGVFTTLIELNQEIPNTFYVEKHFAKNVNETHIDINIYRSMKKVTFVDDFGSVLQATLKVDVSTMQTGDIFRVRLSVTKANTLSVHVIPDDVTKTVNADIRFITHLSVQR